MDDKYKVEWATGKVALGRLASPTPSPRTHTPRAQPFFGSIHSLERTIWTLSPHVFWICAELWQRKEEQASKQQPHQPTHARTLRGAPPSPHTQHTHMNNNKNVNDYLAFVNAIFIFGYILSRALSSPLDFMSQFINSMQSICVFRHLCLFACPFSAVAQTLPNATQHSITYKTYHNRAIQSQ